MLENRGLIKRREFENNRRKNQIEITDKGLTLLRLSMMIGEGYNAKFKQYLKDDEIKKLTAGIKKVYAFYERELQKLKKTSSKDTSDIDF
jgi:MarR family transcriptional regulator, organic hydroperoxide resistance regulator